MKHKALEIPPLLPGRIVHLPGRGEMFIRHHQHSDSSAPTLLLLHGWTGSSDTQFFTAYEELAKDYSIVGVDHRGHGRGIRPHKPFALEDCADDAAAVLRELGISKVTTVGYSMGGPISLLVWQRHPDLVNSMV
jgi:pimeloyl-ACP methyl ester carboxylesterase